jgi:NAD(P)-dependent dehydrogenase (short-subunit alcohol dehydrogenase family)
MAERGEIGKLGARGEGAAQMTELGGRHVVVTGATGGLGVSVVATLLGRGASCHLPFEEPDVPAHLPWADAEGVQICCGIDVGDESAARDFYAKLPPLWASVHLVGGFSMAPLAETSLEAFERMHALNARTCFLCCREAARSMRAAGAGGRIVNVAARPVLEPAAGMAAYAASKAGVAALTQTLAVELRDDGILVNAVVPSIIDTPANRRAMPDADFASWPRPEQLAQTIAFLCSPANALTSGSLVPAYGLA